MTSNTKTLLATTLTLALAQSALAQFGLAPEAPAPRPEPTAAEVQEILQIDTGASGWTLVSTQGRSSGGLDPRRDSLPVENRPVRIDGQVLPGFCYGKARMEALWFREFVRPGARADEATPVESPLGSVHSGNYGEYRMRALAAARDGFQNDMQLQMGRVQAISAQMGSIVAADSNNQGEDVRWRVRQWMREIRRYGSSGMGFSLATAANEGIRHAVLLTRFQECRVQDGAGVVHSAYRFRIVDPNFVEGDSRWDTAESNWLYYLRDEKRLTFDDGYIARYRNLANSLRIQLTGRTLRGFEVQYLDVHLTEGSPYNEALRAAQAD